MKIVEWDAGALERKYHNTMCKWNFRNGIAKDQWLYCGNTSIYHDGVGFLGLKNIKTGDVYDCFIPLEHSTIKDIDIVYENRAIADPIYELPEVGWYNGIHADTVCLIQRTHHKGWQQGFNSSAYNIYAYCKKTGKKKLINWYQVDLNSPITEEFEIPTTFVGKDGIMITDQDVTSHGVNIGIAEPTTKRIVFNNPTLSTFYKDRIAPWQSAL